MRLETQLPKRSLTGLLLRGAVAILLGVVFWLACWWLGWTTLPQGWTRFVAGEGLRRAGLELVHMEAPELSGKALASGRGRIRGSSFVISWEALSLREPLARLRGGSMALVVKGLEVEVDVGSTADPESADPGTVSFERLPWAELIAGLVPPEFESIGIPDARVRLLRSGREQSWTLDLEFARHTGSNPGSSIRLVSAGAGSRLSLEAAIASGEPLVVVSASAAVSRLRELGEAVSFWTKLPEEALGVDGHDLLIRGEISFRRNAWEPGPMSIQAKALSARQKGRNFSLTDLALARAAGPVTAAADEWRNWTGTIQRALTEDTHLRLDLGALRLGTLAEGLQIQAGVIQAADPEGRWSAEIPSASMEIRSSTGITEGRVDFRTSGLQAGFQGHRLDTQGIEASLADRQFRCDFLDVTLRADLAGAPALELPRLSLAGEVAAVSEGFQLSGGGSGWLVFPDQDHNGPVPVALELVRLTAGWSLSAEIPGGSLALADPRIPDVSGISGRLAILIRDRADATIDAELSLEDLSAVWVEGSAPARAARLRLGIHGMEFDPENLQTWTDFLSGGGLQRPDGKGCLRIEFEGVAAELGGGRRLERISGEATGRIEEIDTHSGWSAEILGGRASLPILGMNRLRAHLAGGHSGARAEGRVFIRGTDLPVSFRQRLDWRGGLVTAGTVSITDGPVSGVDAWAGLFPQMEGYALSARVNLEVENRFGPEGLQISGSLRLPQARIGWPENAATLEGLSGGLTFSYGSTAGFAVETADEWTFERFSSGTLGLENGRARLGLADGNLTVSGVRAGGFGGQIFLDPLVMPLAHPSLDTAVTLDNVALDLVLASFPDLPLRGEGRVFGKLPLAWTAPGGLRLGRSRLSAGDGQRLKLEIPELDLVAGERPPWWQLAGRLRHDILRRTQQALRTVEVGEIRLDFREAGEEDAGLRLETEGRFVNEEVRAAIAVDIRIRGELAELVRLGAMATGSFIE